MDIRELSEYRLFSKVYFKYLLVKVRQKISYMAYMKRMTILELFLDAIIRTH